MQMRTDLPFVAAPGDTRFLLVTFEAPRAASSASRPPLDVAFVVDCSGSMSGQKIALARQAVSTALRLLQPTDAFAIVGYDNAIYDTWPLGAATPDHLRDADRRLHALEGGGTTALEAGWRRGASQVADGRIGEHARRALLLTDGLANVGITDPEALVALGRDWRAKGVVTSTFGVGSDFDERLLQGIADAGQGHFYFVERAEQIPDLLTSELGETLETVARDAWLDVALPTGASVTVLGKAPMSASAAGVSVHLGDLTSGESVSVLLAVTVPPTAAGSVHVVRLSVRDRDGVLAAEAGTVEWAVYAADHLPEAEPNVDVTRERARARMWSARDEALEANRTGDYRRARELMVHYRAEFGAVADAEVQLMVGASFADEDALSDALPSVEMKRRHFAAASVQRRRAPSGKARRE